MGRGLGESRRGRAAGMGGAEIYSRGESGPKRQRAPGRGPWGSLFCAEELISGRASLASRRACKACRWSP